MTGFLEVAGLTVDYAGNPPTRALDQVDLTVGRGESLGIVGESGSGKTTLGLAAAGMLPAGARVVAGNAYLNSVSMIHSSPHELRQSRREQLGFVFQNPISSLDPSMRIGRQIALASGRRDKQSILDLLSEVGLPDAQRVSRSYPHQLSGGMAQRAAIARAIAREPACIIADEPTASLDAPYRDAILDLLVTQKTQRGATLVFLTHDLDSVLRYCDRVAVMYAGRVVELGSSRSLFARPTHPYTIGLLKAAPGTELYGERLEPIPGTPPTLHGRAEYCPFHPRCSYAIDFCRAVRPEGRTIGKRQVTCHRATEIAGFDG